MRAHEMHCNAWETRWFLGISEREFINRKYNLVTAPIPLVLPQHSAKLSMAATYNAPCMDEDFENVPLGYLSSTAWTVSLGPTTSSSQLYTPVCSTVPLVYTPTNQYAMVVNTPVTDANCGNVPTSPFGGTKILQLNRNNPVTVNSHRPTKLSQTFSVTMSNFVYNYAYKAFLEDGGHSCCQQACLIFNFYNCSNALISNLSQTIVISGTQPSPCSNPMPPGWTTGNNTPSWIVKSANLCQYIGSCVTVEVIVSGCSTLGHVGYCYYDAQCSNNLPLVANGVQASGNFTSCSGTASISVPSCFTSYNWAGPLSSGVNGATTPTVTTSVSGTYSCTVSLNSVSLTQTLNLTVSPSTSSVSINSNTPAVCQGNTVSLLASGFGVNTFTWSNGPNTASQTPLMNATTYYTVTATNTLGCISSDTRTIIVYPLPYLSLVPSNSFVCPGQSATIQAFSQAPATFSWSTGASSSLIVVSPTTSTGYSATVTSSVGCKTSSSTSVTYFSNPLINLSASSNTLCHGSNATITAYAPPPVSYLWNTSSTSPVLQISPSITSVYIVTVTSPQGCISQDSLKLIVYPRPTVQAQVTNSVICTGQSATVSATGSFIQTYAWSSGATTSSFTVSPSGTTSYSLLVTSAFGCTVTSSNLTITVLPLPLFVTFASGDTICAGESADFSVSGNNLVSCLWSNGASTTAVSVSPSVSTVYTVTVTGSNGCVASASFPLIVEECLSLNANQATKNNISIFPNPAPDEFVIKGTSAEIIFIFSELGQIIKIIKLDAENDYSARVSGLAPGIYLARYSAGTVKITVK